MKAMHKIIQTAMLILILLANAAFILWVADAKADCDEIYLKVGTGYKFDEQNKFQVGGTIQTFENNPYSARIETGVECGNLTWGISHHSQWATGFPFDETGEYYKTEFFIDYKFSWGI